MLAADDQLENPTPRIREFQAVILAGPGSKYVCVTIRRCSIFTGLVFNLLLMMSVEIPPLRRYSRSETAQ